MFKWISSVKNGGRKINLASYVDVSYMELFVQILRQNLTYWWNLTNFTSSLFLLCQVLNLFSQPIRRQFRELGVMITFVMVTFLSIVLAVPLHHNYCCRHHRVCLIKTNNWWCQHTLLSIRLLGIDSHHKLQMPNRNQFLAIKEIEWMLATYAWC